MVIAGLVKNSFVDYPSHLSCVVFTLGCNMDCWYCHNKHMEQKPQIIDESIIFSFLKERKGRLEGVVITGGEPTLHRDLEQFIVKVKAMGFKVKLDSNGTNFEVLKDLIDKKLVDYVAMDIKAPLDNYKKITGVNDNMGSIEASIDLLLSGVVPYEFRTTFSPDLSIDEIEQIAKRIKGAKAYAIQKYRLTPNKVVMAERPVSDHTSAQAAAQKYLNNVIVRGL